MGDLVKYLLEQKRIESGFMLSDLRRTLETRMAALGVTREVRAQVQSHGLGGVQVRHYDRHEYMQEKRDALAAVHGWIASLQRPPKA